MPSRDPSDPTTDDGYLLGSSDSELRRLEFQHRVWAEHTFASWRRAGFGPGQTILDLGCGPGLASLDLAHWVGPDGRVVAFDSSPRYLEVLRRRAAAAGLDRLEIVTGDVHDLELEPESVDAVYARWLFCFSPQPERILAGAVRALRPGGRLLVTDYFNYRAFTLAPRSAAFDRVVAAVETAWSKRGGDLAIQGILPGLVADAGLAVDDIRQSSRTARPADALWAWPQSFFREFLPVLREMELVDEEDETLFWADWSERATAPGSYLCIPPMVDLIASKPAATPGKPIEEAK